MKLYAWQPNGRGELSWFVIAESEAQAKAAVEIEMERRLALPFKDRDQIDGYEVAGWGTDYYKLTVAEPYIVLTNSND